MKVNELFRSIQGEGPSTGAPTVFVRFQGCNLRCSWCDTSYAQQEFEGDADGEGAEMTVNAIVTTIRDFGYTPYVCLTGGEPLMQPAGEMKELIDVLLESGYYVVVETNGSISPPRELFVPYANLSFVVDWKLPSSGMSNEMLSTHFTNLSEKDVVKFVCATEEDYEEAVRLMNGELHVCRATFFFHAAYEKEELSFRIAGAIGVSRWLTEKLLSDERVRQLPWRVGVQLHKLVWEPSTRGV